MPSVFISHNHSDKPFVQKLAKDLKRFGATIWVDEGEIKIGDSLIEKIEAGLQKMDFVAAVISPRSVKSDWVMRELEMAMEINRNGGKIKFLTIVCEECDIPDFLHGNSRAEFHSGKDYYPELFKVCDAIGLEVPLIPPTRSILWTWLKSNKISDFRNAIFCFLDTEDANNVNFAADVMGGSDSWTTEQRNIAAIELLAAFEYGNIPGLAAVKYIMVWPKDNAPIPPAFEDALISKDVTQRIAANLYIKSAFARGSDDEDSHIILPDRGQPLHLRVAAAHLCAWNTLDEVIKNIGTEPIELQKELMQILEDASKSATAASLALPGLTAIIDQVENKDLRYFAAMCISQIIPGLVYQYQAEHLPVLEKANNIIAEWENKLNLPITN